MHKQTKRKYSEGNTYETIKPRARRRLLFDNIPTTVINPITSATLVSTRTHSLNTPHTT